MTTLRDKKWNIDFGWQNGPTGALTYGGTFGGPAAGYYNQNPSVDSGGLLSGGQTPGGTLQSFILNNLIAAPGATQGGNTTVTGDTTDAQLADILNNGGTPTMTFGPPSRTDGGSAYTDAHPSVNPQAQPSGPTMETGAVPGTGGGYAPIKEEKLSGGLLFGKHSFIGNAGENIAKLFGSNSKENDAIRAQNAITTASNNAILAARQSRVDNAPSANAASAATYDARAADERARALAARGDTVVQPREPRPIIPATPSTTPPDNTGSNINFGFLGANFQTPFNGSQFTPVSAPNFSGGLLGGGATPETYKPQEAAGLMNWQSAAEQGKADFNTGYLKDYMKNKPSQLALNWQAYA